MKTVFIIDLLVISLAAGGYFYIQTHFGSAVAGSPLPKPAEFQLTNLTFGSPEVSAGQPITISVNVTNVGEEAGSYLANLTINGVVKETRTVRLSGKASSTVEFEDTESQVGSYSVKMGGLSGTFKIAAAPSAASFGMYALEFSPSEGWVNDSIQITARVINYGQNTGSYSVNLAVNGTAEGNQTVHLSGGATTTVKFTVTEARVGTYSIKLGTITGAFNIVPTGYHTLNIDTSPREGLNFTLDGQTFETPYSALLKVGKYTVVMPTTDQTGQYAFLRWEDGSTTPTRTISLASETRISGSFSGGSSSCPSLYLWNGTSYVYSTEISDHGWLGYIDYMNADGSIVFWRNDPWDYIKLDSSQLSPINGYYNLLLEQRWDEIFYLDSAYMLVVDHPSNVNIYSTMVEQYLDPNHMGNIYTVSKNLLTPISAVNEKGQNVLPEISKMDGIYTPGINGLNSPSWDNITWNRLTLNLGNLTVAKTINLVVRAVVDFGTGEEYNNWLNKFFAQLIPNGTQPTPQPYMEVKDANGNWVPVPESREFPVCADTPRTFVVDLTGLFPTHDYSLRINNFWNTTFDYIGIDTTPLENVTIQRVNPQATLYQALNTTTASAGNFTRYGDVTQLLLNENDEFAIGRQGDAVSLSFPASNLAPLPAGWQRDVFLYEACWFKDKNGNWGYGFPFTVDPLPFHNMTGFPYPLTTESYPYDAAHLSYLQEYNTRAVNTIMEKNETMPLFCSLLGQNVAFSLDSHGFALVVAINSVNYIIHTAYIKGVRKSKRAIIV